MRGLIFAAFVCGLLGCAAGEELLQPPNCNCAAEKDAWVCGSDGKIYRNPCEILRLRNCEGRQLEILTDDMTSCPGIGFCEVARSRALQSNRQDKQVFNIVPECNADGTFQPVQCHQRLNVCWCVHEDTGALIRGSQKEGGRRPDCSSITRNLRLTRKSRDSRSVKKSKKCAEQDKVEFRQNLINMFQDEFKRSASSELEAGEAAASRQRKVVEWKFAELDDNKDGRLALGELRTLKRLVRKLVTPKVCAKRFARFCDADRNKTLSLPEWTACFGLDTEHDRKQLTQAVADQPPVMRRPSSGPNNYIMDYSKGPMLRPSAEKTSDKDETLNKTRARHKKNCTAAKQEALEHNEREPRAGVYMPTCTPDGLYEKVQCHNYRSDKRLCWCADQKTGLPLPGYYVQGDQQHADCEQLEMTIWKGCPADVKQPFMEFLLGSFKNQMPPAAAAAAASDTAVLSWMFNQLDSNRNQVLERSEIQRLRQQILAIGPISQDHALKRCARRIVRYCDTNKDKLIYYDEFFTCFSPNVREDRTKNSKRNSRSSTSGKRTADFNPVKNFLQAKSDKSSR